MDTIGIIVLNWQTPQLSIDTVNSLLRLKNSSHYRHHIYLVDNGSQDNSLSLFHQAFDGHSYVTIVATHSNLGFVEGNNFGIKKAQKDGCNYFLVINSDVFVAPDFLLHLYRFLKTHPQYGIVGPKIYFAPGHEFYQDRYRPIEKGKVIWSVGGDIDWKNIYGTNRGIDEVDRGQYNHNTSTIDYLSGCCLLFKKSLIKRIGLFDKTYFMYLEDADFCRRAIRSGYKIGYVWRSKIWHINSGSSGRGSLHDYFLTRNRLVFGFRYATLRTKIALFRDSLKLLFSPYRWQRIGVIDFYLKKFSLGSWKK